MPIRYRCQSCGQLLGISRRMSGKEFPCPTCGHVGIVPPEEESLPPEVMLEALEAMEPSAPSSRRPVRGQARPEPPPPVERPAERPVEPEHTPREFAEAARSEVRPVAAESGPDDELAFADADDPGGFQVRARQADSDDMDLTPMVDMTFLLLIFFMITASFSVQKSIAFPRPSPDQKGISQTTQTLEDFETSSVIVRIDNRNVIHVDDEPLRDPARLVDVLRASLSTQRNELIVMADDLALHETVVAVIDAGNAVGMQKIRLATQAAE